MQSGVKDVPAEKDNPIKYIEEYTDEVKLYSKNLYLIPDETGLKSKYSFATIANLVNYKFKTDCLRQTIQHWCYKYGWREELLAGVKTTLEDVDVDLFRDLSATEEFINQQRKDRLIEAQENFEETISILMGNGKLIAQEVQKRLLAHPERFSDKTILEAQNNLLGRLIELQKFKIESEREKSIKEDGKDMGLPDLLHELKEKARESGLLSNIIEIGAEV